MNFAFVQAYKQNIRYPKYMLITYGWYSNGWWVGPGSDGQFNCSTEERASVLQYTMGPIQQEFFTEATQHVVTETGLVGVAYHHAQICLLYKHIFNYYFN